jgi:hypothetical protein
MVAWVVYKDRNAWGRGRGRVVEESKGCEGEEGGG